MLQLLCGLLLLVHWLTCIWFIIVRGYGEWIPPKDLVLSDPGDDLNEVLYFYDESMTSKYFIIFYYAILTLAGNDIFPMTTFQQISASIMIILGAIVSAFIFGNMAAIMATLNAKSNQFDEQMDLVNQTMR